MRGGRSKWLKVKLFPEVIPKGQKQVIEVRTALRGQLPPDTDSHCRLLFGAEKLNVRKALLECLDALSSWIKVAMGDIGKGSVRTQQVFDA